MLDYGVTTLNVIRWQRDVTSATVVILYFFNVPGIFDLNITTKKCTYVNKVYHVLIQYQHLSNSFAIIIVVLRGITKSPKIFKIHNLTTHCFKIYRT